MIPRMMVQETGLWVVEMSGVKSIPLPEVLAEDLVQALRTAADVEQTIDDMNVDWQQYVRFAVRRGLYGEARARG